MRFVAYPDRPFLPRLPLDLWLDMLDDFDVDTLLRIRATNSVGDGYVAATLCHRLYQYLHDAVNYEAFVSALEDTGAVLGGYGALRILFPLPHRPLPRFADVFAPLGTYERLVAHLVVVQGFTQSPPPPDPPQAPPVIEDVDGSASSDSDDETVEEPVAPGARRVATRTVLSKGTFRITVVQSTVQCPLLALTAEWNSAQFTYISARDFCSSYSRLNSEGRALVNPLRLKRFRKIPRSLQAEVSTWRADGWEVAREWWPWAAGLCCPGALSEGCGAATRYFGDRFCSRGVLGAVWAQGDSEEVATQRDVWQRETVMWWRGGDLCGRPCHGRMRFILPGARVCHKNAVIGL
ncbi:hypothetical protein OH76DRAFT_1488393 [Lentinus brumalis]|uniref:F-box domain-containing protein n=1 Tax=Lentinus brumalis TaxID=2498619 RepID=A0A371CR96_9APHY|nr:hypothetical protein OH76DRAFT_1488393 [Polyporus brumalis]